MKKAFTLLEILVVMGIIVVILSFGFVSYSTAQKKARDAKRKNDLKEIQNALEQYYAICNYSYPLSSLPDSVCANGTTPDSIVCGSTVIMSSVPTDPLLGTSAKYCYSVSSNTYTLSTRGNLETENAPFILYNRQ